MEDSEEVHFLASEDSLVDRFERGDDLSSLRLRQNRVSALPLSDSLVPRDNDHKSRAGTSPLPRFFKEAKMACVENIEDAGGENSLSVGQSKARGPNELHGIRMLPVVQPTVKPRFGSPFGSYFSMMASVEDAASSPFFFEVTATGVKPDMIA